MRAAFPVRQYGPPGARSRFRILRRETSLGSDPAALLFSNDLWKMPEDGSPDGTWLLYMEEDPREGSRLRAFSMPDRKSILVASSTGRSGARFSPNGRWIAFESPERGQTDILLMPFPNTGPARRVTRTGGSEPRWRADGRELYYPGPDRRLMVMAVNEIGGEPQFSDSRPLFEHRTLDSGYAYSYAATPDRKRFLITERKDRGQIAVMLHWRRE